MADFNRVILLGNLTKDPEKRQAPSGDSVADLRLAVSRRFRGRDGEQREETCFVDVAAWGKQADACERYLGKGSQVLVEGRLKLDTWERDGQKHSRLSVVALRVQFLGSPRNAEYQDGPQGRAAEPQRPAAEDAEDAGDAPPPAGDLPASSPSGDDDNLPF